MSLKNSASNAGRPHTTNYRCSQEARERKSRGTRMRRQFLLGSGPHLVVVDPPRSLGEVETVCDHLNLAFVANIFR